MRARTAVIIPAYNEQATIAEVVAAVRSSDLVDEVIVVSDGSTDATSIEAQTAGARVLALPKKGGKAEAMLHGVAHTDAEVILFTDADLHGLTADHVERLLLPVLSGSRAMNVGLRDRGPIISPLMRYLPLIGGERAMRRQVIEGIPAEFMQGFMVEMALNYYCKTRKLPYGTVFLPKLGIRTKVAKVGWKRALGQYVRMSGQVVQAALAVRIASLFKRF
jgi:5S rRNA maturation endonuclease (ribonuclease M5)